MTLHNFMKKYRANFNLDGISAVHFWKSQWGDFDPTDIRTSISIFFLIYRVILALYFISTLLVTVICAGDEKRPYWLIFLTNWTYTLQTIYAILTLSILIWRKWKGPFEAVCSTGASRLPLPEKVAWILFNVVNAIPYGVTLVFWIILYPAVKDEWLGSATPCQLASNHFAHSLNSVFALLDLFIVAIPVHITHFIFGVTYVMIYLLFSVLYEAAGGDYPYGFDYIYPPLNWKHTPGNAAAFSIVALIAFTFCHFLFAWGLVKVRTYLARKISDFKGQ